MNKRFISSTRSLLQIYELLSFQKPGPFAKFKHLMKKQKAGEYSFQNVFKISTLEIVS